MKIMLKVHLYIALCETFYIFVRQKSKENLENDEENIIYFVDVDCRNHNNFRTSTDKI